MNEATTGVEYQIVDMAVVVQNIGIGVGVLLAAFLVYLYWTYRID